MSKRRGLPETSRMRHDSHFVEQLVRADELPVGRRIPIHLIEANPDQPRSAMGDLVGAHEVDRRQGRARADPRASPRRRALHDHLGRTALSRRPRRGSLGDPVHRDGRPGQRAARDRARREPPAQGPESLRGGRRIQGAPGTTRIHARADRRRRGEVARDDHGGAVDLAGCPTACRRNVGAPTSDRGRSCSSSGRLKDEDLMLAAVAAMARGETLSRDVLREVKKDARRGTSSKLGGMKKAYTLDFAPEDKRYKVSLVLEGTHSQEGRHPRSDSRSRAADRSRGHRPRGAGPLREGESEEVALRRNSRHPKARRFLEAEDRPGG